tara:strand:- start:114 stop:1259 length:1146 start_codon:yes stop_codon:yes gene_type:complete
MPPTKHAKRSPSALKNHAISPCYKPSGGTNEAAERGTFCHEAVETGKLGGLSEEELEHVQVVLDYKAPFEDAATQIWQEIQLKVYAKGEGKKRLGKVLTFGTCDLLILANDGVLDLMDWKFGAWAVDHADSNLQMRTYAIGAFQAHPEVEQIRVHIVQPKCGAPTTHTYRRKQDLDSMIEEVESVIADSVFAEKNKIYIPSYDTCRFCGNLAKCPAVQMRLFHKLEEYKGKRWTSVDTVHPYGEIVDSNANDRQEVAGIAENWAKATKSAQIDRILVEGAEPPSDYRLVSTSSQVFAEGASAWLYANRKQFSLTTTEVMDILKPGKTKLGDVIGAKAEKGGKGSAVNAALEILEEESILIEGATKTFLRKKTKKELSTDSE